jgi:hypothetical protein
LEYDFKTARFTIDEYCSNIKSKIDLQAELKIKAINDQRLNLIQQVDQYQAELFQDLDNRLEKPNVEKAIREVQHFIITGGANPDLI